MTLVVAGVDYVSHHSNSFLNFVNPTVFIRMILKLIRLRGKIPPEEPRACFDIVGFLLVDGLVRSRKLGIVKGGGPVRVIIVDDMTLVRQGIRSLLQDRDSVQIIAEASGVQEAAELISQHNPDVVLLDQDMPGLDNSQAITMIKEQVAQVEVIVLSEKPDEERAFSAFEAGASGYILKDISPDNLVRAIQGVCDGKTVMHPYITRQLIERFRVLMQERSRSRDGGHPAGLTNRELEIIVEMTKGSTDREIAEKACLGESTVKSHIRSILRKIGARNRTQAVAYALRNGLMR